MVTASDVKRALAAYVDSEREIDNQIERLSILEEKMYSVGSPGMSDMPRNPSPAMDRMSDMVNKKMELEGKISRTMQEQRKWLQCMENVVERVRSSDKRAVVRIRYFDGERWDSVTEAMFGAKDDFDDRRDSYTRRVMILHGQALQEMAAIIEEDAEARLIIGL